MVVRLWEMKPTYETCPVIDIQVSENHMKDTKKWLLARVYWATSRFVLRTISTPGWLSRAFDASLIPIYSR